MAIKEKIKLLGGIHVGETTGVHSMSEGSRKDLLERM